MTDIEIRMLRDSVIRRPRKNAIDRSCIKDCDAALAGDAACREVVINRWSNRYRHEPARPTQRTGEGSR